MACQRPYLGVTDLTSSCDFYDHFEFILTILLNSKFGRIKKNSPDLCKVSKPHCTMFKRGQYSEKTPLVSVLYQCKSHTATINACIVTNTSKEKLFKKCWRFKCIVRLCFLFIVCLDVLCAYQKHWIFTKRTFLSICA